MIHPLFHRTARFRCRLSIEPLEGNEYMKLWKDQTCLKNNKSSTYHCTSTKPCILIYLFINMNDCFWIHNYLNNENPCSRRQFVSVMPGTIFWLRNNTDRLVCDALIRTMWRVSSWLRSWIMWALYDYPFIYKEPVKFDRHFTVWNKRFESFLLCFRLSMKSKVRSGLCLSLATFERYPRHY